MVIIVHDGKRLAQPKGANWIWREKICCQNDYLCCDSKANRMMHFMIFRSCI